MVAVTLAIQGLYIIFPNQQMKCIIENTSTLRLYLYKLNGGKTFLSLRLTLLRFHNIIIVCEIFFACIVYRNGLEDNASEPCKLRNR